MADNFNRTGMFMLTSQIMVHDFEPGDFLIFQLESGYALLRVLDVDASEGVWHVAAYSDFYLDPETADAALENPTGLTPERPHLALTNHAFESTQTARLRNVPLVEKELEGYNAWKASGNKEVHDRSIRLLLGLR
ncbi:MAG TPA: hypothetical protein VMZ26_04220 [Pyrinomonadaceae bacterium]|nr:hypothetical protein [Pyrinomonadaceae bacterium]